jgi:hypothetical protein
MTKIRGKKPTTDATADADIHTELTHNPRGVLTSASDDGAQQGHQHNHKDDDVNDDIIGSRTADGEVG